MDLRRKLGKDHGINRWESLQDFEHKTLNLGKIPPIKVDADQILSWCEENLPRFSRFGKYQKGLYVNFSKEVAERLIIKWIEQWSSTVEQGRIVAPQAHTKKELKDSIKKMVTLKGTIRIHE